MKWKTVLFIVFLMSVYVSYAYQELISPIMTESDPWFRMYGVSAYNNTINGSYHWIGNQTFNNITVYNISMYNVTGNVSASGFCYLNGTCIEGYLTSEEDPFSYHYGNCSGISNDCGYISGESDTLLTVLNRGNIASREIDMNYNSILNINYSTYNGLYIPYGSEKTGTIYYDNASHTFSSVLENGVILQNGQELHIYGKNTGGEIIHNGDAVSITSVAGQFTSFGLTNVSNVISSYSFVGLATQEIGINDFGYVTSRGIVRDIDTSNLTEGRPAYVNPLQVGNLTSTYPTAPQFIITVGIVEYSHKNHGRINVVPFVVPRLQDLSDVDGTPLTSDGQILVWNNTGKYFDATYNINNISGSTNYWNETNNSLIEKNTSNKVGIRTQQIPTYDFQVGDNTPIGSIANVEKTSFTDITSGEITYDYGVGSYTANGYFQEYYIYAYQELGGGKRAYSTNPLDISNGDDASTNQYKINVNWNNVSGADGYRIVVYYDDAFGANGNYYFDTVNNYTTIGNTGLGDIYNGPVYFPNISDITLSFEYGSGSYTAEGNGFEYYIYAYKTIGGVKIYSAVPYYLMAYDDSSLNNFKIRLDWNAVSSADGYKVVVLNDAPAMASTDYYFETTSTTATIGTSSVGDIYIYENPIVTTPSSPYTFNDYSFFVNVTEQRATARHFSTYDMYLNGVPISHSGGSFSVGDNAGLGAGGYGNYIGSQAGSGATGSTNSQFFGTGAGKISSGTEYTSAFGYYAGSETISASYSNFFGNYAGYRTSAYSSNFFGNNAGRDAKNAYRSNFFGESAGQNANNSYNSNFFGYNAGKDATSASGSNFFGLDAGKSALSATDSNFFGSNAGASATNAFSSNFFGTSSGSGARNAYRSNFFGTVAGAGATNAGDSNGFGYYALGLATNASYTNSFGEYSGYSAKRANYSNFFGSYAGYGANDANDAIFIGTRAGYNDLVNNNKSGTSICIGRYCGTGGFSDSIAIGHGVKNSAVNQTNIGNVLYLNYIYSKSDTQSSAPTLNGSVGVRTNTPRSALDVNGSILSTNVTATNICLTNGICLVNSTRFVNGTGTSGQLAFWTDSNTIGSGNWLSVNNASQTLQISGLTTINNSLSVTGNTTLNNITINGQFLLNNTVWDDVSVYLLGAGKPSTNPYKVGTFIGNLEQAYFENTVLNTEQNADLSIQMPHRALQGSIPEFHCHGSTGNNNGTGQNVTFSVEYTCANLSGTYQATRSLTKSFNISEFGDGGFYSSNLLTFGNLSGCNIGLSEIITLRLHRNSSLASDTFNQNYYILSCDTHIEMSRLGSDEMTSG